MSSLSRSSFYFVFYITHSMAQICCKFYEAVLRSSLFFLETDMKKRLALSSCLFVSTHLEASGQRTSRNTGF